MTFNSETLKEKLFAYLFFILLFGSITICSANNKPSNRARIIELTRQIDKFEHLIEEETNKTKIETYTLIVINLNNKLSILFKNL